MYSASQTSWANVDLSAIAANVTFLSKKVPNKQTLLIVKADAYGHGLIPVSQLAESIGVSYLGITNPEDVRHLREAGIKLPIVLFAEPPISDLAKLVDQDVHLVISSVEYLRQFVAWEGSLRLDFHIKLNSGLNRLGVNLDEVSTVIDILESSGRRPAGLATHFSSAAIDQGVTAKELTKFTNAFDKFRENGVRFNIIHARNSAATVWLKESLTNTVRLGLAAYGLQPSATRTLPLQPVMSWKAKIIGLRIVQLGEHVGYGGAHKADKSIRVGILGIGYSDGLRRSPRHQQYVLFKDRKVPIIADVMMNHTLIDLSESPEAGVDDEVMLLGHDLTAEVIANNIGTINEEVVTNIPVTIPRIYID